MKGPYCKILTPPPGYVTITEAAELTRHKRAVVYRKVQQGQLKYRYQAGHYWISIESLPALAAPSA